MAEEVGAEDLAKGRLLNLWFSIFPRYLRSSDPMLARYLKSRPSNSRFPPCEDAPDSQRPVYTSPTANTCVADDNIKLRSCPVQMLAKPLHRDKAQEIKSLLPKMYAPLKQLSDAW